MSVSYIPELVDLGCFAANNAVLDMIETDPGSTGAERTRAAVEAALTALIEQGYLAVAPQEQWPMFFRPCPMKASDE